MEENIELGYISRDAAGNILVNKDGYMTCTSEGGLNFQVLYKDIDFTNETLECTVGEKRVFVNLHDGGNKENNSSLDLNRNKAFTWTDGSTKLFIDLYKEKKVLLSNRKIKTRKIMWQNICECMKTLGYDVTTLQVENKMKSLERSYKNMITNNKQTGRGRMTCAYENELTDLFGYKHSVEPLVVSGKEGTIMRKDRVNTMQTEAREGVIDDPGIPADTNQEHNIQNMDTDDNEALYPYVSLEEEREEGSTNIMVTRNILPQKNVRKQVGHTGRLLEKCHKTLDKLTENILKERNEKLDVQKQILTEYKKITTIYEDITETIKTQLTTANNLRQERNDLLRNFVPARKN